MKMNKIILLLAIINLFLIACTSQQTSQTEATTTESTISTQTPSKISTENTLLKNIKLIKDTGDVKVKYLEGSDSILILDYDNFAEGSGIREEDIGNEFNNKFVIKTIDNLGNEEVLDKSRFSPRRFRDSERINAIDLLITPEPYEEGLNIYKKDNGELIYSLKFKVLSYWSPNTK